MIENEQIVIETKPAIRQAHVVRSICGQFFDEIFKIVPEIPDCRAERKISGSRVLVEHELVAQDIEWIALDGRCASWRNDFRAASLRAENLRWLSGENRVAGCTGNSIQPNRVRFRREFGEPVARFGPWLLLKGGLLIHGWGSCLRP